MGPTVLQGDRLFCDILSLFPVHPIRPKEGLLPERLLMPSDAGVPGLADLLSRQHYEMSGLRTQP